VARVLHASDRRIFAGCIECVGKRPLDESGKYPVNENDEEIFAQGARDAPVSSRVPIHSVVLSRHCERSEAIHLTA
jgi:hypothetical protein